MNEKRRPSRLVAAIVACSWVVLLAAFVVGFGFDYRLAAIGRDDLSTALDPIDLVFCVALLSSSIVGSALILRRPGHPVGWLFLSLGLSLAFSFIFESYTTYGVVARPGSLPASEFVATLADATWISWLTIFGLVLLLTPGGRLVSRPSRVIAAAVLAGGVVANAAALFRPYRGPYVDLGIENPLAPEGLTPLLNAVGLTAIVVLHLGLLAALVMLIVRFRAADRTSRRKLRWLALAAIPFPLFVVGAWLAASSGNEFLLTLASAGFVTVIPLAAALAIEQDHLYDVDHLLSRSLTYALLTTALISCYVAVVLFVGESLGGFGGDSSAPAVVATLVTVSVALPARRYLQAALDRRFNRRRFEAVAAIRNFVREPAPSITLERALQEALRDEHVAVAYWIDERERWVDEQGTPAVPGAQAAIVERRGATIASVGYDPERTERRTLDAVLAEALAEIENARLRAAIALQLVEVRESRARIVAAQVAERHKIERNLHDGAQQRLLAIAMELRAAEVADNPECMRTTLDTAVQQLQKAVGELRELANGLHPSVLADGGIAAAMDDLAARTPVTVRLDVTPERFPAPLEEAAWFIVCEAVTNAVKHARPKVIEITANHCNGRLQLTVADDGRGGADPLGTGLRGISDRAEAAGGWLTVRDRHSGGTIVRTELPCAP